MIATASRGVSLSGISIKNILYFLLFVAVILFLFFIPEILKYDWSAWFASGGKRQIRDEVAEPRISPLQDVLNRINSGQYAPRVTTQQGRVAVPRPSELTWEYIRSPQVKAEMDRGLALARSLLEKYKVQQRDDTIRRALIAYISGVETIQGGTSNAMTPEEAAAYLERLDLSVARALQAPHVDQEDFVRWSEFSAAPAYAGIRAVSLKQQAAKTFDPDFTIKRLEIIRARYDAASGRPPQTQIAMLGSVQGKDIKSMTLYRNGNYVGKIPFDRPDKKGKREFLLKRTEATGTFKIRIEKKDGSTYERVYRFFPAIQQFPRIRSVYQLKHSEDKLDPRIEKLFLIREGMPGAEKAKKGMVEF